MEYKKNESANNTNKNWTALYSLITVTLCSLLQLTTRRQTTWTPGLLIILASPKASELAS